MTVGLALALLLAAVLVLSGLIVSWKVGVRSGGIFVFCGMIALCTAGVIALSSSGISAKLFPRQEHIEKTPSSSFDKDLTVEITKDRHDGQMMKIVRSRRTGEVISVVPLKQETSRQEEIAPSMLPQTIPFHVEPIENR